MVSNNYIKRNLKSLKSKYDRSKTQAEPYYYSKLAIIELCGWIEISLDEIYISHSKKFIKNDTFCKKINDRIGNTHGFHQNKHLYPLLVSIIGYHGLEKLENLCDTGRLGNLTRNLNELTIIRNKLAHTYIKGFMTTIDSPQVTYRRFEELEDGLKHLDEKLTELKRTLIQ